MDGGLGDRPSYHPRFSNGGRFVIYTSRASNLVASPPDAAVYATPL